MGVLAIAVILVTNCANEIKDPPEWGGGSAGFCVYESASKCIAVQSTDCPSGGYYSPQCPYTSSSSSESAGGSSSSTTQSSNGGNDTSSDSGNDTSSDSGGDTSSSSLSTTQSSSDGATTSSSSGTSLCGANPYSPATQFCDTRDYKVYKYETALDGLVWMSENLNYSKGSTIGYCYKDGSFVLGTPGEEGVGCDSPYGRNYTWTEAMDDACPNGWHLPSHTEWATISGLNKMSSNFYVKAGNYSTTWKERGTSTTATNINGFYWASNAPGNFARMYNSSGNYLQSNRSDAVTADVFSVRCVEGVLTGGSSSSGNNSSSSAWTVPTVSQTLNEGGKLTGSFSAFVADGGFGAQIWYKISVVPSTDYWLWFYDSNNGGSDCSPGVSCTLDAKYTVYHSNGDIFSTANDMSPYSLYHSSTASEFIYIKVYPNPESNGTGNFGVAYTTSSNRP